MNEGGCLRGDEKVHQKGYNIILSLVKPEGDEEWKRERVRERPFFLAIYILFKKRYSIIIRRFTRVKYKSFFYSLLWFNKQHNLYPISSIILTKND